MPRKGWRSISLDQPTYGTIDTFLEERGTSKKKHADFVRELINMYKDLPLFRVLVNLGIKPEEVEWGASWKRDSHFLDVILRDPEIRFYKSTAWIRTEQYPEKAGYPQWGNVLEERLAKAKSAEEFSLEKILIVSEKAFDSKETWRWIWLWVSRKIRYPDKIEVVVVKEERAKREFEVTYKRARKDEKDIFYDMGIYGTKLVGLLEINDKSDPLRYRWIPHSLIPAEEAFAKLKNLGMKDEEVRRKLISEPIDLSAGIQKTSQQ